MTVYFYSLPSWETVMDSFNFKHFLASLGALSLEQRHGLGQALKGLEHA